jgi:phosphoribosylamine--glycine ligase / phosphoribosylformylglycinamidine cyclo-ligase
MITDARPKVLEYNARFGDPEAQSILLLLASDVDLAEVMLACTQRRLHELNVEFSPSFACNVVIAAGGYPITYQQGDVIRIGVLPDDK